jgi:hypothetical protein
MNYKVDPDDSQQNAFVQDWLIAWAKKHTVLGSDDWMQEAQKNIRERPVWAKQWRITIHGQIKDAEEIQSVIDHIQETYSHEDHMKHERVSSVAKDDEVYVLTTFIFDHHPSGTTIVDQEVFAEKPTFDLEPNMMLRVANINGGDSAPA